MKMIPVPRFPGSFHLWPVLAVMTACSVVLAQEPQAISVDEEKPEPPTCVFSGIAWQGASISGLGYFLEGTKESEFIEVFLPNGSRSRKYAYYGSSPLVLFRAVEIDEDEPEPDPAEPLEDVEPEKFVYQPVVSHPLSPGVKDLFLFFFKGEGDDGTLQLSAINFDPAGFPAGSYWFFSRCPDALSLQFGRDKLVLPAFAQRIVPARIDEFGDLVFRVYRKRAGASRKVYSTIWNYNPRARLLVFLTPSPNGVTIRRITDLVKEEKALGLRPPKEDKEGGGSKRDP